MQNFLKKQAGLLLKGFGVALFFALCVVTPRAALAQSSFDATCAAKGGCWGPLITCTGDYTGVVPHQTIQSTGKPTPVCSSVCDVAVLLNTWIFFAYSIILYILTPLGVAAGGFVWLTSMGSAERVTTARGILGTTFKGLAIATVVVFAVGFVISTIGIKEGGTSSATTSLGMNIVCDKGSDSIKVLDPDLGQ